MRKDALQKLINKHKNFRSSIITLFLQNKKSLDNGYVDISFAEFKEYLKENRLDLIIPPDVLKNHRDSDLFLFFILLENKKDEKQTFSNSILIKIFNEQKDISRKVLSKYLSTRDMVILSSSHRLFDAEIRGKHYWKNRLIEIQCNKELIGKLFDVNVIQNYKNLYCSLLRIGCISREKINDLWEMLCLSGDIRAVVYAIEHEKISAETRNQWGESPLHSAALSGSVSAMEIILDRTRIDPCIKTTSGETIMHFAAWSGSVRAMENTLTVKNAKDESIDPLAKTNPGLTIMHYAAWSGSVSAMEKALTLKTAKDESVDPLAKTNAGSTIIHLAASSGSVSAMEKALTLKNAIGKSIDPLAKSNNGLTAIHYAASSGSVNAMKKALTLRNAKGESIDPLAKTNLGDNIIHYATASGSVDMIVYLRVLSHDFAFGLDPKTENSNKHNAFWFAEQSKNATAVKAALSAPIESLRAHYNNITKAANKVSDEKTSTTVSTAVKPG